MTEAPVEAADEATARSADDAKIAPRPIACRPRRSAERGSGSIPMWPRPRRYDRRRRVKGRTDRPLTVSWRWRAVFEAKRVARSEAERPPATTDITAAISAGGEAL
jgi:hypothetical protein